MVGAGQVTGGRQVARLARESARGAISLAPDLSGYPARTGNALARFWWVAVDHKAAVLFTAAADSA